MLHKYSRQREIIRSFIKGRNDHPTADVVYANVRKELPNISLGTVYRNLLFMVDNNELVKVDVGDGTIHFDPTISQHSHFVCECCGKIKDITIMADDSTIDAVESNERVKIKSHSILFKGLCDKCRKN